MGKNDSKQPLVFVDTDKRDQLRRMRITEFLASYIPPQPQTGWDSSHYLPALVVK
jgi:hypothetical protein